MANYAVKLGYTLIFETVHGSRAYNLHTQTSDTDIKGIIIGPKAWYFGIDTAPEQISLSDDHVHYELRKFLRLARAANPSVLEILWTNTEHHRHITEEGERILACRQDFLSLKVKDTFVGYALGQLKRIRSHRRWLLEPPTSPPTRRGYQLPERTLIPRDQLGAAEQLIAQGRLAEAELTPNFLAVLDRERRYRQAQKNWRQYQTWKKSRNPSRAALEARFGYDTKHAMHLIRLLRMGCEILSTGTVNVWRTDRDELLAIRRGAWSYDALIERAEALCADVQRLASSSPLPEEPDAAAIEKLAVELISNLLSRAR